MKNISQMTDHELLMELVQEKRRDERLRKWKLALVLLLVAAIAVLCILYLPPVIRNVRQVNSTMGRIDQALDQVQELLDQLKSSGADKALEAAGQLNESLQALKDFLRLP